MLVRLSQGVKWDNRVSRIAPGRSIGLDETLDGDALSGHTSPGRGERSLLGPFSLPAASVAPTGAGRRDCSAVV